MSSFIKLLLNGRTPSAEAISSANENINPFFTETYLQQLAQATRDFIPTGPCHIRILPFRDVLWFGIVSVYLQVKDI